LFLKTLIACIIFFSFISKIQANEKQSIINYLSSINNFTFNFKQTTNEKIENGNCILAFDNKLKCFYDDKLQKEIIINNKTLVILQKRYNKKYFYSISKSPFLNILSKDKLINLIKNSDIILKENIELTYVDENQRKIKVFFEKENYKLIGWLVEDQLQNKIYFSLKINEINIKIDNKDFKIPSPN
jgi:outer membrane lipoprotein-sorting protein|tara:strand:+ start:548 stop:1105 length:558 start_codon:yes stop_codon:yes gene_type:complete